MAHDMYLTYEEYLALGGAIDAAAWPPLECACRKRIDRITDCRVQNMAEVPKAVKLCIFALAQMESAVGSVAQVISRQKLATACMIKRLVGDLVILALLIAAHSVIVGLSYMPILLGGMGY